jgi:hypothetical protein
VQVVFNSLLFASSAARLLPNVEILARENYSRLLAPFACLCSLVQDIKNEKVWNFRLKLVEFISA